MPKKLGNYILKKLIKYNILAIKVLALAFIFVFTLSFYKYYYQSINNIADIYQLRERINFQTIAEDKISQIYNDIEKKINQEKESVAGLESPFNKLNIIKKN